MEEVKLLEKVEDLMEVETLLMVKTRKIELLPQMMQLFLFQKIEGEKSIRKIDKKFRIEVFVFKKAEILSRKMLIISEIL